MGRTVARKLQKKRKEKPSENKAAKRARKEQQSSSAKPVRPPNVAVQTAFVAYCQELDQRQVVHEKIFSLNRELTFGSKKVISLLHRITVHSSPEEREEKLAEAEAKLRELRDEKLRAIAEEAGGSDRHARTFSGGVQEYIEALTYFHFLKNGTIPNHESSVGLCSTEDGPRFPLSTPDYVLGFADLAGELMRTATWAAAASNRELPGQLLIFLQEMEAAFHLLDAFSMQNFIRKLQALRASVCKVERLCYSMHVRGDEVLPSHLVAAVNDAEAEDLRLE